MRARTSHLLGWWLFLASAVFYSLSSWRAGDWISFAGSLLFIVACLLFLIPLVRRME